VSSTPSIVAKISRSPLLIAPWISPSTALPTIFSTSGMSAASWLSMPGTPSGLVKSFLKDELTSVPLLTLPAGSKPCATLIGISGGKASLVPSPVCEGRLPRAGAAVVSPPLQPASASDRAASGRSFERFTSHLDGREARHHLALGVAVCVERQAHRPGEREQ